VERLKVLIRGDVQGVGFRYFLTGAAQPLGLRGWVRNRRDGSVEVVAEGRRADLDELLKAARRGPRLALVTSVDVEWLPASGGLEPFGLID
jgi:acylphosphatase